IDQAQFSFMPAPMVANRQIAGVAASARALANRRQRLIGAIGRQVIIDHRGGETQARSDRSVCLDRHRLFSFLTSVSTCETGATFKSFFAYWMLGAPSWTCSLRLGWDSLNPAPNRHRYNFLTGCRYTPAFSVPASSGHTPSSSPSDSR